MKRFCRVQVMGQSFGLFPTPSLIRLLVSSNFWHREINTLRGQPSWLEFYREDHPSDALPTTVGIVSEFRRVAIQRGKSMLVVIFPDRQAFDILQRTGRSPFEPLVEALNRRGIQVIDLTKNFAIYLRSRGFCDVVTGACGGHLNAEGNQVVANALREHITASGLLTQNHKFGQ